MPPGKGLVHKVLMTADTIGGIWTYALELSRGLHRHGIEVHLATMGAPLSSLQRRELRTVMNVHLHESNYKLEWMDKPWQDVEAAGAWLLEILERTAPDIVHINGFAHASLSWNCPVLVVAHSCVYSWFAAVRGTPPPARWERY